MDLIIKALIILGSTEICALTAWFLLRDYFHDKCSYYKELTKSELYKQQREMAEYSDQTLKFIREFIADTAVLKFKSYQDNTLMERITRENLSRFTDGVIRDIKIALREEQIKTEYLIYDQAYIDAYIIDTTMIMIKKIFEEALENDESNIME